METLECVSQERIILSELNGNEPATTFLDQMETMDSEPPTEQLYDNFPINTSNDPIIRPRMESVILGPQHFDILKLIGEGGFGSVYVVRNRLATHDDIYAMKVVSKKLLKKKNHVAYMRAERDILTKMTHPFIVSLKYAFQTDTKLYLVMDFLQGGELFFHLKRRGLILEREAQFYLAEMVLAVEFLHNSGIIHRDLKPENILLSAEAHVCITDFGFAKEIGGNDNNRTLCGTSEYMAPEMLVRNGYGKSVDWWSLGALCFEMLTGNPPFRAKTSKELDKKILHEKLTTPSFLSSSAHALLRGMLDKDVNKRLGSAKSTMFSIGGVAALKMHVFFEGLSWERLLKKEIEPPIELQRGMQGDNTINFHEGFTSRVVTPSILEDNITSTLSSPVNRSAAGSDNDEDAFADFNYSVPFECSAEQLMEFERILSGKVLKANKRLSLKQKKTEEKQGKVVQEEEALRRRQDEALEAVRVKELEENRRAERAELLLVLQKERRVQAEYTAALAEHQSAVERNQKKLKNLRKKLRDVVELQGKLAGGAVLTVEQKEKVSRQQALEDDICECEEEEETLQSSIPVAPVFAILCDAMRVLELEKQEQATIPPVVDEAVMVVQEATASVSASAVPPDKKDVSPPPAKRVELPEKWETIAVVKKKSSSGGAPNKKKNN